ncbi:hypothetical protein J3T78_04565 [Staphylococcus nepalensis]|uniref:Phage protein n=1 Tax=Staphylococcus nepalensis TaxID=214473 RepID=A0ABS3L063_9STAP|nr:hypothetical protein [Staphylococcus nepalensis]MBO1213800.1 hypothetical protein [Staphylococcus nepalensis]MBO1214979.1 hypothetical protein [Staphylococcus nepalensis]MBO1226935.1 hypothetical protein [Staphylococcus nepalensis]MBO1234049.1 hypothetical protein [Staphylococcus nepalensis]MBO1236982.1 hypothetical protein [Staphylococcus nepalensis]
MSEETATIRYKVYVEKKVYVNQGESDNDEIERMHNEMWTLRDEYMDAEPLEFEDVKIIDRGY